jgi:protein-S-isoprenylcysteine O-methyltransferase Ste14
MPPFATNNIAMTTIQFFWASLASVWVLLEIGVAVKTRTRPQLQDNNHYHTEHWIWGIVIAAVLAALWLKQQHWLPLPITPILRQGLAGAIFSAGIGLRLSAILTLRRFFSTSVTVQPQHIVITSGPYHWLRHPAYAGLLLAFTGAGIAMGDILALTVLLLPVIYVLRQRIQVEEQWLLLHLGKPYADYCQGRKRLLPWIY